MKLLTLQKRAVIASLFFYVLSISYAFIDPTGNIKELNQAIEKFEIPIFGDLTDWVIVVSAILSLGFFLTFYYFAYQNSKRAIHFFVAATFFSCVLLLSDMGPQLDSGVNAVIELFACTLDGIIIACIVLGRGYGS